MTLRLAARRVVLDHSAGSRCGTGFRLSSVGAADAPDELERGAIFGEHLPLPKPVMSRQR